MIYTTYADCLAAANTRARELGVEVAVRERDAGGYVIQQRYELPQAATKLVAVAKPR